MTTTVKAMQRALHLMELENWSWNSSASTDEKRAACHDLREAIAAELATNTQGAKT